MTAPDSHVVFRVGEEEYALPVNNVSSIIRYTAATAVPHSPEVVLGVINLRGKVIPVVDLTRRFRGEPISPSASSRILVAEGASGVVGLAVDAVSEVTTFSDETRLSSVPEGVVGEDVAGAFAGVFERDDRLVILLDFDETVSPGLRSPERSYKEGDDNV